MIKKDKEFLIKLGLWIFVILYFILPPHNKLAQWGYLFNNISYALETSPSKLEKTEYMFHRNNAVYLTRMDSKTSALKEMDKAVTTFPVSLPDAQLYSLYKDRAELNLYYREYNKALTDFLRLPNPDMTTMLKIAMLFKQQGKRKTAVTWCNKILEMDIRAYAGYACLADVYADAGKYESAVTIMDLLIDRVPNRGRYYYDRAQYKKITGDLDGYDVDMKKSEEFSSGINYDGKSITKEAINPKSLILTIN